MFVCVTAKKERVFVSVRVCERDGEGRERRRQAGNECTIEKGESKAASRRSVGLQHKQEPPAKHGQKVNTELLIC